VYVWRGSALATLSLMTAVMAGAWMAVLVLYVVHGSLGLRPIGYGVILSLLAVGGWPAPLVSRPIQRTLATGRSSPQTSWPPPRCSQPPP